MSGLTKIEVARRQLGTALHMFLNDMDPVSVHCLASGGAEVAEELTRLAGHVTMRNLAMDGRQNITQRAYNDAKRLHWNVLKHHSGRDDSELLAEFNDQQNDAILFVGWFDFMQTGNPYPIEAHVFINWYLVLFPEKFVTTDGLNLKERVLDRFFPNLAELPRNEQKDMLRSVIEIARRNKAYMADSHVDGRPLILPLDLTSP